MKFSVCVPATRAATVSHTIRSIRAQTHTDWEIIVIGQGAADAVRAAVVAAAADEPRVRWLHTERRGASSARNAGLQAAQGEVIALLDDDCEAAPDWLATIDRCLDEQPDVGVVGGALVAPPRARRGPANCPALIPSDATYDPMRDRFRAPAGWDWVTSNVAIRRRVIDRIGFFDECLGPGARFPSCEDTDLKLRLERAGIRMRTTPQSRVVHTFGWRYGLRAVLRHQRNYARGNGAMAAKLSLMGDARGQEWWHAMRDDCIGRWWRRRQLVQLPAGLRRWYYFRGAFAECVTNFVVDEIGMLQPVPSRREVLAAAVR